MPQPMPPVIKPPLFMPPQLSDYNDLIRNQNRLSTILVEQHERSVLPQPEIDKFDGEALNFQAFLRAFENRIERHVSDPTDRLYYLEQLTTGEPNELVRSYLHMQPSLGFIKAKEELIYKFGDEYKIAKAHLNKLLKRSPMKYDNPTQMNKFAVALKSSLNAMVDIGYLDELNHPKNLLELMDLLPYATKERWRRKTNSIKRYQHRIADFKDFVRFVEGEADMLNDPVYGKVYDNDRKQTKNQTTTHNSKPTHNSQFTKQRSFATTTEEKVTCIFCNGSHNLDDCKDFKRISLEERRNFARTKFLCYGCLETNHDSRNCPKKKTCSICQKPHPTVFHIDGFQPNQRYNSKPNSDYQQTAKSSTNSKPPNNQTHVKQSNDQKLSTTTGAVKNGYVNITSYIIKDTTETDLLMSIVPVRLRCNRRTLITYAFQDNGSGGCFVTLDVVQRLGLKGDNLQLLLGTMHGESLVDSCAYDNLQISDLNGEYTIDLPRTNMRDEIPASTARIPTPEIIQRWQYLSDVPINDFLPGIEIGLLIGTNCPKAIEPLEVISSQDNGPFAVRTRLGWSITGPIQADVSPRIVDCNRIIVKECDPLVNCHQLAVTETIKEVDIETKKLLDVFEAEFKDNDSNKLGPSKEDIEFMRKVDNSIEYSEGHYVIPLPFKEDDAHLPNNKAQALKRLSYLKRKLEKDSTLFNDYTEFMNGIISKGYAVRVPEDQLNVTNGNVWYIPHHAVYHPRKPDKVRVVFDCSAQFQQKSLNNALLQGPHLTSSLVGVLTRFREKQIAFMADVEAMFYQVNVPPNHQDFLRFLWWPNGNINAEPTEFKMTVHLFGAVSSPSCANYALRQTSKDNAESYDQNVISIVERNFYVDDLLKSCNDVQEAIKVATEVIDVCAKGGFNLTKFISNSRTFLKSIDEDRHAKDVKELQLEYDDLPIERALGVHWCIENDSFGFRIIIKPKPLTRRGILSTIASIFDPLGFVAPVTLKAKRILQDLCRVNIGWDDDIPIHHETEWRRWLEELPLLEQFVIDRCLQPVNFGPIIASEIHHFADASTSGYGTVSYQRTVNRRNEIHCSFLIGKSRLSPIKLVTIPRLELQAATMATQVGRMIKEELNSTDSVTYWTDSTTVLKYINNEDKRFHVFVANRVSQILQTTQPLQWRKVHTKSNPADYSSRTTSPQEFLKSTQWVLGPEFLWQPKETWTNQDFDKLIPDNDPEVRSNLLTFATDATPLVNATMNLIERYSSYHRLKRVIALMLRVKSYLIGKVRGIDTHTDWKADLSIDELDSAEIALLKFVQSQAFSDEIKILSRNVKDNQPKCQDDNNKVKDGNTKLTVQKSSPLSKIDPWFDNGIIRVGGRLSRADIPYEAKYPIVIPKSGHVTALIIRHVHQSIGHSGRAHTLSIIREKYWIINSNSIVRFTLSKCVTCRKLNKPVMEQKMADLPLNRVTPAPVFTYTGVDFVGPFMVKEGKKELKRYGVLFTCLVVRAIHIEIACSLDTSSFILALRRFIARRGQVLEIRSDNGTNFCGAERELRLEIDKWNQNVINDELLQQNIKWMFNPPSGSHHGGVWERQIRSVRKVLNSLLRDAGNPRLNDESFSTLMCEVESIINSRPLTFVSDDPKDLNPLTPNQLLTQRTKWLVPPGEFVKEDLYARKYWKRVQFLADSFWKRWNKEYLVTLQQRAKWQIQKRNINIDDIVLIVDENQPRNYWSMARVVDVFKDKNDLVRSATVKTKSSTLVRPIDKLVLLLP